MTFLTVVLAVAGFFGFAMLVLAPVLLALAVSDGRQRRWVRRHAVSPCAALRPGTGLPRRFAVYGETVPGPDGPVVAPLSGVEAVWFQTIVYSDDSVGDPGLTRTVILHEQSAGDPFGVADGTGTVAVTADILQASRADPRPSVWARTRLPVADAGPTPVRTVVNEETTSHRRNGRWLQQLIDRGAVRPDAARRVDRVRVVEQVVPPGVPLHVIGQPVILDGGIAALTLPRTGRYLVLSREPSATERELAGGRTYGTGCAIWAAVAGAACFAVVWGISFALAR
ncbi:hypothetical protein [Micromonospora endolithica]|uniref:RING-type E3 ubiquitin transferase n=1 Tax=Micromonospora endolithica TaxID=230091 RepID=A0A3A9ZTC6_9ACTN|nr:hypothetical protein [Micromonospora endolithica]RKN50727.1 hypothetical protein D7223_02900 [Micromonospora endolithica]TWJ20532.1 hypothetical protein JD76_00630 [Micromonospora endolithica]